MATTAEENERLTRVGPGTPGGELLRRYWHPVAAALELADNPVKLVRLLGEDLVLYRTREGEYGLDRYDVPASLRVDGIRRARSSGSALRIPRLALRLDREVRRSSV